MVATCYKWLQAVPSELDVIPPVVIPATFYTTFVVHCTLVSDLSVCCARVVYALHAQLRVAYIVLHTSYTCAAHGVPGGISGVSPILQVCV